MDYRVRRLGDLRHLLRSKIICVSFDKLATKYCNCLKDVTKRMGQIRSYKVRCPADIVYSNVLDTCWSLEQLPSALFDDVIASQEVTAAHYMAISTYISDYIAIHEEMGNYPTAERLREQLILIARDPVLEIEELDIEELVDLYKMYSERILHNCLPELGLLEDPTDAEVNLADIVLSRAAFLDDARLYSMLQDRGLVRWDNANVLRRAALVACQHDAEQLMILVLQKGYDPSSTFEDGPGIQEDTALHRAIRADSTRVSQQLINAGTEVNAVNLAGDRPLHIASERGHEKILLRLLEKGADPNAGDIGTWKPLHAASGHLAKRNPDVISILLDGGADPNAQDAGGYTALQLSIAEYHKDMIDRLLRSEVIDLNLSNQDHDSALHLAVRHNNLETVEKLLIHGAKVSPQDDNWITPLHLAAQSSTHDRRLIAEASIRHNAEVDAADFRKWTPLHCAANYGALETARVLLENGAFTSPEDTLHQTPLDLASNRNHRELVDLLISYGATFGSLTQ